MTLKVAGEDDGAGLSQFHKENLAAGRVPWSILDQHSRVSEEAVLLNMENENKSVQSERWPATRIPSGQRPVSLDDSWSPVDEAARSQAAVATTKS